MSYTFGMRAPTVKASQSAQPSAAAQQQPATGTTSSLFGSTTTRAFTSPSGPGFKTKDLPKTMNPLAPAAPKAPKITENITDQYFEKEKTKSGMLSTFLGRDTSLSSNVRRRNELSNLLA